MTYRDITPDDLTLPGDVLGGALLNGWHGVVAYDQGRALIRGAAGERLYLCHNTGPEHPPAVGFSDAGLLCTLPAMRDRLCRVLMERGHDLLWLHNAEVRGDVTPLVAAALWWCSALRVEAGMDPVKGMFSAWYTATGEHHVRKQVVGPDKWGPIYVAMSSHPRYALDGWRITKTGSASRVLHRGPETGDAGKAAADAAALSAGYALRNPDHLLLPLPDAVARLPLENA